MVAFNPAVLAALRGNTGGSPAPRGALVQPLTSNERSLVGDKLLPVQGRSITPIQGVRGGYDVAYNGNPVGQLLRGGPNGRFVSNGAAIPSILNSPGQQPQLGPGMPAGQPMRLGGGMGGPMAPPRQYAPNPFQQQMMQAQMMRKPVAVAAPPPQGGVGYNPNG